MSEMTPDTDGKRWTATELRKLPAAERNRILAAAAESAAEAYRTDPELTDFEAYGDEDLYTDSANDETG